MTYPPRYELYPGGEVVAVQEPIRVPAPVPHTVKFRHADTPKKCGSSTCPEAERQIAAGAKYARVQRVNHKRRAVTELYHPKCYDYEFGMEDG